MYSCDECFDMRQPHTIKKNWRSTTIRSEESNYQTMI